MHHNFILKKTISSTAVAKQWPSQYEVGQEEGVFCTEAHTVWKSSLQDYDPNEYPSRSESIGELVNQTPYRNSSPDLSLYNPQGSGRVGLFGIKKKKKKQHRCLSPKPLCSQRETSKFTGDISVVLRHNCFVCEIPNNICSVLTQPSPTKYYLLFSSPLFKLYRVCGAPSGGVFAPFWSESGYTLCPFWTGIGYSSLFERVVQYTRTVTVRIMHLTIRTDRKDLKMAYNP